MAFFRVSANIGKPDSILSARFQAFRLAGFSSKIASNESNSRDKGQRSGRLITVVDRPETIQFPQITEDASEFQLGPSCCKIYCKIAEGTFPSQMKISALGAGLHESAINRWIANPAHYREEEPAV